MTLARFVSKAQWPLGLAAAGLFAAAYLVMREVDSLLLTLESAGQQRYGMGALFGFRLDAETAKNALALWAKVNGPAPFGWVKVHTGFDMIFALGYAGLLAVALTWVWSDKRWALAALPVLLLDIAENVVTFVLADQAGRRAVQGADLEPLSLANHLYKVSFAKWIFFGVAVGLVVIGLLRRWHEVTKPKEDAGPRWRAVIWRLRAQIGVVALLAFLVAVPSRNRLGALEQLPDVVRWYFDPSYLDVVSLISSGLALAAIGGAVWLTAHWLPYDVPGVTVAPGGLRWPYRVIAAIGVAWLAVGFVQGLWPQALTPLGVSPVPPWASSWQLAIPQFVAAAVLLTVWLLHNRLANGAAPNTPPRWHERHARTVHLLAVVPVAIGGLGLVRSAAGVALLPETRTAGALWIGIGTVVAVVIAPLLLFGVGFLCRTELPPADQDAPDAQPARPIVVSRPISVGVLVGVGLLALVLAIWPAQVGSRLGTLGVLDAALALSVLGLGGLVAIALRAEPIAVDQVSAEKKRLVTLPGITVLAVALAAANVADTVADYHDVRTLAGPAPVSRNLADHFTAWQNGVAACRTGTPSPPPSPLSPPPSPQNRRIQPMVFVAAAGGGMRAAYWTEKALLQLTGRDAGEDDATARCRHDSVFLVSAVSGGGVGSALWSARDRGAGRDDAPYATDIADQRALASIGAAWVFRDGVRALSGLDFVWPDRAAVMEDSWRRSLADRIDLGQPLLQVGQEWQPLLLLNGTDLQTGCRVVIAAIAPANPPDLPRHCADAGERGADMPGAYFAPEFLDTAQCRSGGGNLSVATAALLAARFPYVTPTGSMYACSTEPPGQKPKVVRIQVGDGGYLESTGLQAVLQTWRAIAPLVAQHNREVLDPSREPSVLPGALIMPVIVAIGNGYRSVAVVPAPDRQNELLAPLASKDIAKEAISPGRLQAEARAEFARPVPGTDQAFPGLDVRVIDLAPASRPEVTAPLGWTLSPLTQQTLDLQLADLVRDSTYLRLVRELMTGEVLASRLATAATSGAFP
jgi:hypothetical protein